MLISNAPVFFARLHPAHPNPTFNPERPTWELQIRTYDAKQAAEWTKAGLGVKNIMPEEGEPYWRVNLRKHSIKSDGTPADPVRVVDGKLRPISPEVGIGNESVANIRIYQYEYEDKVSKKKKMGNVLMAVQLTRLIPYVPKPRDDDFAETDFVNEGADMTGGESPTPMEDADY